MRSTTTQATGRSRAGAGSRRVGVVMALVLAPIAAAGQQATPSLDKAQATPVSPASVDTTNQFDGDWTITVDCPAQGGASGAKGYVIDFPASVLNGRLFGSRGAQGSEGAGCQVEGTDRPRRATRCSRRAVARWRPTSPGTACRPARRSRYDIQAHFEGAKGAGKRMQDRDCGFAFARR